MIWHYKRYFNCDSKNAIYMMMCNTCEWFYLGQIANLKQRIRKHKSDFFHPQNSYFKKCSEHLPDCSRMKEPFFRIYMRIKKNHASLRKTFHDEMHTTVEYLSINSLNKYFRYSQKKSLIAFDILG